MKKAIFLFLLLFPFVLLAQEDIVPVVVDGDRVSYDYKKGAVVAQGNVHLKHKDVELFCDKAEYDAKAHLAQASGNVRIVKEDATIFADEIAYDFNTQDAHIGELKYLDPPIYGKAEGAEKKGKEKYILKESEVTTCELEEPHFRLIARKITVYPGERVEARNLVVKVGKIPVFYFPYFSHDLKDKSFPGELIPGKNSEWGFHILSRWRYYLNEASRGKFLLDYYEDRGFGRGITHALKNTGLGEALFNLYYLEDELYALDKRGDLFDEFPERVGIPSEYLEDDRYRMQFSHDWQPTSRLSIKSEFHKFSDESFMKDFFFREYQIEPRPKTYNLIDYALENSAFSLFTQKRVNVYLSDTEYLPQLEYNFYRQKLGQSPLYLESKITLASLSHERADYGVINPGTDDESLRFHSHNVFSLPLKMGWLYVNPYGGVFNTFYSKDIFGQNDINRFAPEGGIDLSTKLHKKFDVDLNILGENIKHMRHVLTPTVRYSYIHDPTVSKDHLFQFDEIDDLEREEKIVFSLENKIHAQNDERIWDFLYFSPSVEYAIHDDGKGSHFKKLFAEFEFYPKKGISLISEAEYDFEEELTKEVNVDLNFSDTKNNKYAVSVGHRYLRKESSQGTLNFKYQLTPKLEFSNYLRYEYKTGEFQEQQYRFRRDLHCWWMDFGVDIDRDENFSVWLVFRLKAFPDVNVGFEQSYSGAL
ncbi:MAG: LPS-assembly protein LptD [Candidatus Omnitrophota bacterium]|nr:MAG: LPS-assembly protein LptD [Candidatus Omnitrophota bacterium]